MQGTDWIQYNVKWKQNGKMQRLSADSLFSVQKSRLKWKYIKYKWKYNGNLIDFLEIKWYADGIEYMCCKRNRRLVRFNCI